MDNLADRLNITNYREHPTRPGYHVFHFFEKHKADDFENLLKENNIWYEAAVETENNKTVYLFGVRNSDFKKVIKLNFLVIGKYRQPFIPNKAFRYFVIFFGLLIIFIAIFGYLKANGFLN